MEENKPNYSPEHPQQPSDEQPLNSPPTDAISAPGLEPKAAARHQASTQEFAPHKKNWRSYFWEFLMLFLAVSLGAYVENMRESKLNEEEVQMHIQSLLSDLEADIDLLERVNERNSFSAQMADSLIELLHSDSKNTSEIYLTARTVTANLGYTYSNSKSFDQMKSSGLLRYIKPNYLLDSIGSYYISFQWLNNQTDLLRLKMDEIHKKNTLLFDSYQFQQMMKSGYQKDADNRTIIDKPAIEPTLLSTNINDINSVSLNYHYYSSTIKFFTIRSLAQLDRAKRLVALIKKEYGLKEKE